MSAAEALREARTAGIELRIEGCDLVLGADSRRRAVSWNAWPVTNRKLLPCCMRLARSSKRTEGDLRSSSSQPALRRSASVIEILSNASAGAGRAPSAPSSREYSAPENVGARPSIPSAPSASALSPNPASYLEVPLLRTNANAADDSDHHGFPTVRTDMLKPPPRTTEIRCAK